MGKEDFAKKTCPKLSLCLQ